MIATYTEMVVFFPNTLFKKMMLERSPSSRLPVANKSPISRQSVADNRWLLETNRWPVADQSTICRQPIADQSPTKC